MTPRTRLISAFSGLNVIRKQESLCSEQDRTTLRASCPNTLDTRVTQLPCLAHPLTASQEYRAWGSWVAPLFT